MDLACRFGSLLKRRYKHKWLTDGSTITERKYTLPGNSIDRIISERTHSAQLIFNHNTSYNHEDQLCSENSSHIKYRCSTKSY